LRDESFTRARRRERRDLEDGVGFLDTSASQAIACAAGFQERDLRREVSNNSVESSVGGGGECTEASAHIYARHCGPIRDRGCGPRVMTWEPLVDSTATSALLT